jgi:predicted oxidoreductase
MQRIQMTEDLSFSRIIHGLWRLADWDQPKEDTLSLIQHNIESGITTFDHADIYGSYTCEALFGEALSLQPSLREKMEIVTKCGIVLPSDNRPQHKTHHYNTSKKHILASVENSLQHLKTDYIDLLLIHRPDPFMNGEEVAEAFSQLKEEGKVRHFGVSNFKDHQWNMLQLGEFCRRHFKPLSGKARGTNGMVTTGRRDDFQRRRGESCQASTNIKENPRRNRCKRD